MTTLRQRVSDKELLERFTGGSETMLPQGRPGNPFPQPIPSVFPVKQVRAAGHLRKKRPDQTRVLLVEGNAGDACLVREMLAGGGGGRGDLIRVSPLSGALRR